MEIAKIYPLGAVYDTLEDVPEDIMLIIYDTFVICFSTCFMILILL
jgi:hypothetical protein